jgi:hypothetical protein
MTAPRVRYVIPFGLLFAAVMTVPIVKLLQALGVAGPSFYGWYLLLLAGAASLVFLLYQFLFRWRALIRAARNKDHLWDEEWGS